MLESCRTYLKLARSLLRNREDIMVCDLDAERVGSFRAEGAKGTMQAAEVMRNCDFVITCLPSPRPLMQ